MINNYKLEKLEAISFIILLNVSKLIANVTFYSVTAVGSGAIMNFIFIGIIDFLFMMLIIKLQEKFQNSDILDISEFLGGKILKFIFGIISILFFLLSTFMTTIDFSTIIQKVYFSNFSIIYIILFFIIATLTANIIGLKSISRINLLIIPFVILAIIITFFSIIFSEINIRNLIPIFGESYYKTFIIGLSNISIMYNLSYILFLKPLIKESNEFKKICISSYLISWMCVFLVIIAISLLFNSVSVQSPSNSVFLIVRVVSFGNFIERIDSLFILLCVISIFNYLSFIIFFINRIIKKMFNITNDKMLSFSTCSILFALVLIPLSISDLSFIENTIFRYSMIFYTFILEFIILLLANIKKGVKKRKI